MGRHFPSSRSLLAVITRSIATTVLALFTGLVMADVAQAPIPGQQLAEQSPPADSESQSVQSRGVYKGIDRGISIDAPTDSDVLYPGGDLNIVYRVTGEQRPTTVRFVLFDQDYLGQ